MPLSDIGDIKIYHELHGEGHPMVLLNGWGGSSEAWSREMIEALSRGNRVLVLDNRGTGWSDRPDGDFTMETMAGDVAGLMESLGISEAHVLGFSMGGILAQVFALEHPDRVTSLILCGTTCSGPHSVPVSEDAQRDLAVIANPPPEMPQEEPMKLLFNLLYTPGYVEENLDRLIEEEKSWSNSTPPETLAKQYAAIAMVDNYDRLVEIGAPTLVLTGDRDILVPPENSEILARGIPQAQLHVIPGAGHGFLKEFTGEAVEVIRDFLNGVEAGSN